MKLSKIPSKSLRGHAERKVNGSDWGIGNSCNARSRVLLMIFLSCSFFSLTCYVRVLFALFTHMLCSLYSCSVSSIHSRVLFVIFMFCSFYSLTCCVRYIRVLFVLFIHMFYSLYSCSVRYIHSHVVFSIFVFCSFYSFTCSVRYIRVLFVLFTHVFCSLSCSVCSIQSRILVVIFH